MISRTATACLIFLLGAGSGIAVTALVSQRASYYWSTERFANVLSELERKSKTLAASEDREGAKRQLIAALLLREEMGKKASSELTWPLSWPSTALLDIVASPAEPSIDASGIYSDSAVTFMYECALVNLTVPPEEDRDRSKELDRVVARYPKRSRSSCEATGTAFWMK